MPSVGLDIGHGANTFPPSKGVYKGGKGYAEHDFNSALATAIESKLYRCGVQVYKAQEPHSNDVPLIARTNFYNNKKVDLVWSIHANFSGNSDVHGICSFYWHDHKESKRSAEIFIEEVKQAGFDTHGNGLHASEKGSWTDLHMVRETKMTAVLTENGFMSNPEDFKRIFQDKSYIEKLAIVHAKAICRALGVQYKGEVTVASVKNEKPSPFAEVAQKFVMDNNISDGSRPKDPITRQEVWVMLERFSKLNK